MYMNNSRDSSKLDICGLLYISSNLKGKFHADGYFYFTN